MVSNEYRHNVRTGLYFGAGLQIGTGLLAAHESLITMAHHAPSFFQSGDPFQLIGHYENSYIPATHNVLVQVGKTLVDFSHPAEFVHRAVVDINPPDIKFFLGTLVTAGIAVIAAKILFRSRKGDPEGLVRSPIGTPSYANS